MGDREPHARCVEPTFTLVGIDLLLLDIGGIIIRDDLAEAMYFWGIYKDLLEVSPSITPRRFFRAREELMMQGRTDWLHLYALPILGEERLARATDESWSAVLANWNNLSLPIAGAVEAVERLSRRTRLGLVANQPCEIRHTLQALGVLRFFDVIAIDAELPYSKPDPRIFGWALAEAGVPPHRAIMIGDRIDNDIAAAMRLGMRTVWLSGVPVPLSCTAYPRAWSVAFHSSRRRVGPHNQHSYCSGLRTVAAHYRGSDLSWIAASAANDSAPS